MYATRKPTNLDDERWSASIARVRRTEEHVVWREQRALHGWSQDQLAVMVGVSAKTIASWESGTTWPRSHMTRYMDVLLRLGDVDCALRDDARRGPGRPVG